MLTKQLYLDCNAHMPMSKASMKAFIEANEAFSGHGHPMSPNSPGRAAETAIEASRHKIASLLGVGDSSKIIFTSTCTQACEWTLDIFKSASLDNIVYFSPFEHPAIRYKIQDFPSSKFLEHDGGIVKPPTDSNAAVICIKLQNELGTIQPIEKLGSQKLVSDMSQALGKIDVDLSHVDIAIFGGHKFGGSSSVGFFYLKERELWKEFGSGSRYFFDRPGTPDVPAIVATTAALEESLNSLSERTQRCEEFRNVLEPSLEELGFTIIAKNSLRHPGTSFVRLPNSGTSFALIHLLAQYGIHIGLGSACGSMYAGTSHIIQAMGLQNDANSYVRISNYGFYGKNEASYVIDKIAYILKDFG